MQQLTELFVCGGSLSNFVNKDKYTAWWKSSVFLLNILDSCGSLSSGVFILIIDTNTLGRTISEFKFAHITNDFLLDYRIHLENSGCKPRTINQRLEVIMAYMKYSDIQCIDLTQFFSATVRYFIPNYPRNNT